MSANASLNRNDNPLTARQLEERRQSLSRFPFTGDGYNRLEEIRPRDGHCRWWCGLQAQDFGRQLTTIEVEFFASRYCAVFEPDVDNTAPENPQKCQQVGCPEKVRPESKNVLLPNGEPLIYKSGSRAGQTVRDGIFVIGDDGETILGLCFKHRSMLRRERQEGNSRDDWNYYPYWRAVEVVDERRLHNEENLSNHVRNEDLERVIGLPGSDGGPATERGQGAVVPDADGTASRDGEASRRAKREFQRG